MALWKSRSKNRISQKMMVNWLIIDIYYYYISFADIDKLKMWLYEFSIRQESSTEGHKHGPENNWTPSALTGGHFRSRCLCWTKKIHLTPIMTPLLHAAIWKTLQDLKDLHLQAQKQFLPRCHQWTELHKSLPPPPQHHHNTSHYRAENRTVFNSAINVQSISLYLYLYICITCTNIFK